VNALDRLSPMIQRTRRILTLATAARAGVPDVVGLREAAAEMLSWREDRIVRVDIQEGLGVSFLPRLWRLGIDASLGVWLWRPLMLAAHEVVGQANRLAAVAGRSVA
jgi:hypothetical protein